MPPRGWAPCCSTICATQCSRRVGQDATRRLAADVFRHLHRLSLRFHLERRTGAVTKVVERGTKSIDTMLYFLLFNIAPTILELALVLGIFWTRLRPLAGGGHA